MAHIWKSLVADSKKTIDENLDLIMDDLLNQCGSRLWRSREASCLALADVTQGRKFHEVINFIHFFLCNIRIFKSLLIILFVLKLSSKQLSVNYFQVFLNGKGLYSV